MCEHLSPAPEGASKPSRPLLARRRGWDRLGALISGVCLLHCLALPLAPAAVAWVGTLHEEVHFLLAPLLLPVTYAALRRRAGSPEGSGGRRLVLITGLALVWMALPLHAVLGETAETIATVLGSLTLASGHLLRLARPGPRSAPPAVPRCAHGVHPAFMESGGLIERVHGRPIQLPHLPPVHRPPSDGRPKARRAGIPWNRTARDER